MTLALAPQCCCGRAGFLRDASSWCWAAVHPSEVDAFGRLANHEPWMVPATVWQDYAGGPHDHYILWPPGSGERHLLGFDHERNRLLFANVLFQPGSFDPIVDVVSVDPSQAWRGEVVARPFLDNAIAAAVLNGSLPPASATIIERYAGWSAYSNGRLYGFSTWLRVTPPGEYDERNFRAWSVATNGGDYQEHFTRPGSFGPGTPGVIRTMGVADGHIYAHHTAASSTLHEIRRDDALVGRLDTVGTLGNLYADMRPDAVLGIGDRTLVFCLGSWVGENSQPATTALVSMNDDAEIFSGRVQFIAEFANEPGREFEFFPNGIAWDAPSRSAVVIWIYAAPGVGGYDLRYCLTYISRPPLPGNLVGQQGVTIYSAHLSGGGMGRGVPYAPAGMGVMLSGKLPEPLKVTGRVIEPPPPPPPPPPDCSGLDNCPGAMTANGNITELVDVHDGPGSDPAFNAYTDMVWTYANFNRGYAAAKTQPGVGIPPGSQCSGGFVGPTYDFWVQLGTQSDYSDPGILLRYTSYPNPNLRDEIYVYGINFGLKCENGRLTIDRMYIAAQRWLNYDPNAATWPVFFPPLHQLCGRPAELRLASGGTVLGGGCITSPMQSEFEFDNWYNGFVGPNRFQVLLTIGGTP